ncbi:MAG: hypothetical protein ACJA1R_001291 [Flavobacteriales bacterium]|jgi:hypothetical protein
MLTLRLPRCSRRFGGIGLWLPLAVALQGCPSAEPVPESTVDEGSAATPPAPVVTALGESEPNDLPEQATTIALGRPLEGTSLEGDVDTLSIPAGDGAVSFSLKTATAAEVTFSRPQNGARFSITTEANVPRVIGPLERNTSIRVAIEGGGAWQLELNPNDVARCGFAEEPDSRERPGVVLTSVPSLVSGCLSSVDDVDVYSITADALSEVPGMAVEISGVEGVSFLLRIESEAGTLLTELSGGPNELLRLPNLAAPPHGDARLVVSSLAGANERIPYRMELRRLPPLNGTIEVEPNDDPVRATIVRGPQLINGYLHRPGDRDFFRILSDEPAVVRLVADPPAGVDLQLEIPGGPLGTMTIDDAGVAEAEQVCSIRLNDDDEGTLFGVFARAVGEAATSPYLVRFEIFDSQQWESEPNDDLAQVLSIQHTVPEAERPVVGIWLGARSLGGQVSGYAFPPGDVDRFVLEVFADPRAQATYTSVTLRLEPNGATDYALEVVDEDGAAVALANNGAIGESETVSLDLPAGRYVARVALQGGDACAQPYRLSVLQTALPGTAPPPPEGSGAGLDGTGRPSEPSGAPQERIIIVREPAPTPSDEEADVDTIERPDVREVPPPPGLMPPELRDAGSGNIRRGALRPNEQPPTLQPIVPR